MSHNKTRSRKKRKKERYSLLKDYQFEIIVLSLFGMGVFLLVEKMKIKSYVYHFLLDIISFVKKVIISLFEIVTRIVGTIETSDIVGIILIVIAIGMVFARMRLRIFRRYSYLDSCPECDGDLRRVHRTFFQKVIEFLLIAKVKHYSCKKCSYKGFTIGYRSNK